MEPNTPESPPGCLVILIPLSAAMMADARVWLAHRFTAEGEPDVRELPGEFAARFLADELIEGLVNALTAGYPLPLDVAVLGYGNGEDGKLKLTSLLVDREPKDRFVPLADVANLPAEPRTREGDPRKWTTALPCEGSALAADALAEVYLLLATWLTGRYGARPPVVIHCTSGEGLDETYLRIARSIGLLTTAYGPARLLHYGFAAGIEPTLCGAWPEEVPEPWVWLFDVSFVLPAEPEGRPARHAVSVNDWALADPWSAAFDLVPLDDSTDWMAPEINRFLPTLREFWTQKLGNKAEEWEDAYATDAVAGVAVVADGASSGIYCRIWADQLAKRFISDRPDASDPTALGKWVHGLRGEWRTAINYSSLNWAKQRKVDETGAAATFLSLEVGPLDAWGNRPWRARAVGDASLFWVRGGKLLATFPVVGADQFGSAPLLIRSNPGFRTVALSATGTCQPGDVFLLATDAVAGRLLKSETTGTGPEWENFETLEADAWRKDLDDLRKSHEMVNDDCTLVVVRVVGSEVPVSATPPTNEGAIGETPATSELALVESPESMPEDVEELESVLECDEEDDRQTESSELPAPEARETDSSPLAQSESEPSRVPSEAGSTTHDEVVQPDSTDAREEIGTSESKRPNARDGFSDSTDKPV